MEYDSMLREPELLSGLTDLLDDDENVVKRITRVFAGLYRHAINALATGEMDEATFKAAWPSVKGVAEKLMRMLAAAENEGVIIHIIRFLEAALVAHLVSDITSYPELAEEGMLLVTKGIDTLTDLLTTPYVGGSSFIVAMRAIISVACYKPDLREDVIDLVEKQIASPPPTLFDHNVRSLNKILQRNLFRILRRTNCLSLRGRLIEMMVTVGVPRKLLSQWAPPHEGRKRSPPLPNSDEIVSGRNSPPYKKAKYESCSDDEGRTTPSDPRDIRVPKDSRELKDPRLAKEPHDFQERATPRDPRTCKKHESSSESRHSTSDSPPPQYSPPPHPTPPPVPSSSDAPPLPSEKAPSKPSTPSTSGRSTPVETKENSTKNPKQTASSNFEFLKNLITSTKESTSAKPFLEKCSNKERALYERLDHPRVVEVVLFCLESVPDSPPDDLLSQLGYSGGDVNGIREHLTRTLAPHVTLDFINSLTPPHESSSVPLTNPANLSRPSSASSVSTAFSSRSSPPPSNHRESSPPSPPSSNRSTPTDPNQMCVSDVDLRKYLDRGFSKTGDIDMRTSDPRRTISDPRSSKRNQDNCGSERNPSVIPRHSSTDSKTSTTSLDSRVSNILPRTDEAENRMSIPHSSIMDPRITLEDPRRSNFNQRGLIDLPQPFSDMRDPRMNVPPNSMMNNDRNFHSDPRFSNDRNYVGMAPDPRMTMPNGPFDPSYNNKYGMHCGMNYPDPRMGNMMNFSKGPMNNVPVNMNNGMGPMNINDQRFRPGIFGPAPRPNLPLNNVPWGNMPVHNKGPGIFSQVPPMHL